MAIWVRLGAVPFTRRRDLVPGRPEQGLGQREHGLLQGADLVRHIVLGRVIFATVSWISVCPGCERSSPASGSSWPARCPSTVSSSPPAAVTCCRPPVTCWLIVSSLPVTSAKRPLAVSSGRPACRHLGAPLDRRDLLVELTGPLGEFGHDLVQAAEAPAADSILCCSLPRSAAAGSAAHPARSAPVRHSPRPSPRSAHGECISATGATWARSSSMCSASDPAHCGGLWLASSRCRARPQPCRQARHLPLAHLPRRAVRGPPSAAGCPLARHVRPLVGGLLLDRAGEQIAHAIRRPTGPHRSKTWLPTRGYPTDPWCSFRRAAPWRYAGPARASSRGSSGSGRVDQDDAGSTESP